MSHSVIFVNLCGPLIVAWRYMKKEFIHSLEYFGCGLAIAGSVISVMDHSAHKANPDE